MVPEPQDPFSNLRCPRCGSYNTSLTEDVNKAKCERCTKVFNPRSASTVFSASFYLITGILLIIISILSFLYQSTPILISLSLVLASISYIFNYITGKSLSPSPILYRIATYALWIAILLIFVNAIVGLAAEI
jgi:uncharacterized C2H2 Zn-finger protein